MATKVTALSSAVNELKELPAPVGEECAGRQEPPRPLALFDPEERCRQCPWAHCYVLGEGMVLRGLCEASGHRAQPHVDTQTHLRENGLL